MAKDKPGVSELGDWEGLGNRTDLPGVEAVHGPEETQRRILDRAVDELEEGVMSEDEFVEFTGMTEKEALNRLGDS